MNMIDTYQCQGVIDHAQGLKDLGVHAVGLYYFNHSGFKQQLTKAVAKAVSAKDLYIVSVWEDGYPTHREYFGSESGYSDGLRAVERASAASQPANTPIYFAVDYDAAEGDLPYIQSYFAAVNKRLKIGTSVGLYEVGVYGSGLVCEHLTTRGLVSKTWLSESTGFLGYSSWKDKASIVQGHSRRLLGMDVDTDQTSGSAGGWKV